jgi:hypothetical protein
MVAPDLSGQVAKQNAEQAELARQQVPRSAAASLDGVPGLGGASTADGTPASTCSVAQRLTVRTRKASPLPRRKSQALPLPLPPPDHPPTVSSPAGRWNERDGAELGTAMMACLTPIAPHRGDAPSSDDNGSENKHSDRSGLPDNDDPHGMARAAGKPPAADAADDESTRREANEQHLCSFDLTAMSPPPSHIAVPGDAVAAVSLPFSPWVPPRTRALARRRSSAMSSTEGGDQVDDIAYVADDGDDVTMFPTELSALAATVVEVDGDTSTADFMFGGAASDHDEDNARGAPLPPSHTDDATTHLPGELDTIARLERLNRLFETDFGGGAQADAMRLDDIIALAARDGLV